MPSPANLTALPGQPDDWDDSPGPGSGSALRCQRRPGASGRCYRMMSASAAADNSPIKYAPAGPGWPVRARAHRPDVWAGPGRPGPTRGLSGIAGLGRAGSQRRNKSSNGGGGRPAGIRARLVRREVERGRAAGPVAPLEPAGVKGRRFTGGSRAPRAAATGCGPCVGPVECDSDGAPASHSRAGTGLLLSGASSETRSRPEAVPTWPCLSLTGSDAGRAREPESVLP